MALKALSLGRTASYMAAGMMLGCWDGVYSAHRRRYLIVNRVVNALCYQIEENPNCGEAVVPGLWLREWSRPTRVKHRAQHMTHSYRWGCRGA